MELFVNPLSLLVLAGVGTTLTLLMAYWRSASWRNRLAYAYRHQR
jgi:hypothetical protein